MADVLHDSDYKISKQALGLFEKGKTHPKAATLRAIASVFGVRSRELMQTEFELQFIGFRSLASLSKTHRERIQSIMSWRAEKRETLIATSGSTRNDWSLEKYNVSSLEQADEIALIVREKWDLGFGGIQSLADNIEKNGGEVIEIADDTRFSGLSAYSSDGRPYIAVQHRSEDGARQRMDMAHELAHLVLDTDSPVDEEQFAHRFAGAFLLTRDNVTSELGHHRRDLNLQELKALKLKYGVSIQAWVRRAKDVGVISETTYKNLCFRIGRAGLRSNEGHPFVHPEPLDRDFHLAARSITERGLSIEDAAALASLPPDVFAEPLPVQTTPQTKRNIRSLSREERRTLAKKGAALTAESYRNTPEDFLPDLAEIFED